MPVLSTVFQSALGDEVKNENEMTSCIIFLRLSAGKSGNPFCSCFAEYIYWTFS